MSKFRLLHTTYLNPYQLSSQADGKSTLALLTTKKNLDSAQGGDEAGLRLIKPQGLEDSLSLPVPVERLKRILGDVEHIDMAYELQKGEGSAWCRVKKGLQDTLHSEGSNWKLTEIDRLPKGHLAFTVSYPYSNAEASLRAETDLADHLVMFTLEPIC